MPETYAVETVRRAYTQIRTVTVGGRALTLLYSPDGKSMLVNGVFEMEREDAPGFLSAFWETEPLAQPRSILERDIDLIRKTYPGARIIQIQKPEERRQRFLPFLEAFGRDCVLLRGT